MVRALPSLPSRGRAAPSSRPERRTLLRRTVPCGGGGVHPSARASIRRGAGPSGVAGRASGGSVRALCLCWSGALARPGAWILAISHCSGCPNPRVVIAGRSLFLLLRRAARCVVWADYPCTNGWLGKQSVPKLGSAAARRGIGRELPRRLDPMAAPVGLVWSSGPGFSNSRGHSCLTSACSRQARPRELHAGGECR
jgi:hypothetical protein